MRWTTHPHIVFGVNLEEANIRPRFQNGAVMLRLQANTGTVWQNAMVGKMQRFKQGNIFATKMEKRAGLAEVRPRRFGQAFGVRLPGPLGVEMLVQVPLGTSLKALPA